MHSQAGADEGRWAEFPTTHWSVVLAARRPDSPEASAALETLCRTYWYPLYAFVRRQGQSPEDAQDLTQAFFAHLLRKDFLKGVGPEKGRFRSFLLAGLNHFLSDERARASAQKRGGGQPLLWFDAQAAEERYHLEPVDERSPDKLFERRWALTLLDQVLARLEQESHEAGKADQFAHLRGFLVTGRGEASYAEAAAELGLTAAAAKKAVHRMRHRYYALFRQEIAHTVADPAEVEDEMRHLCAVIAG